MKTIASALFALLVWDCAAFAGQALYRVEDCSKAVAQPDLDQCAEDNRESADKALNATYKTLLARLKEPSAIERLKRAERAWISTRDKSCQDEVGPEDEGGSIWPMEMSNCLEEKTAARLRELDRELHCSGKSCKPK